MFIGGRLIIGFGISFTTSAGPSLLNELAHPRMRGQIASMFNVLWYVGSIIASWLTFGTGYLSTSWSWRIPSLVQGAPALFVLITTFFMPESPRYLLSRGRTAEALHILSTYHANGAPNDPLVTHSISQITAALAIERASRSTTWRRTLSTHPNRRRLGIVAAVAILTLWTGQSAISYYFSPILASVGIASTAQQTGINGGLQIWNLLCAAAGALLADRVGRRPLWLASFGGMLLANVPLTVASACYATRGSVAAAYVTVVWLFLYNAAFNVACNPLLYAYTTEILPYGLRVKGLALQIALGQAALTVNSYVNPIALDRIGYWLFVFYAGMLVIAVGVVWRWFPETKGMSLEELMGLFGEEEKGLGGVEEIVGVEYTGEAGDGVEGAVVVPKGNGSVKGTSKGEQV
ncbi:hexose transporter [Neofusicoccum parvum]|nr:hexose transporter [Neofusicoccum parvum]